MDRELELSTIKHYGLGGETGRHTGLKISGVPSESDSFCRLGGSSFSPDCDTRPAKPLAIDLFCGLGGWAEGFLAEGYTVIGFDIERHDYGTGGYPGHLVLQDVLTLHGSQFKDAAVIVASPPCQEFSCTGLPFKQFKNLIPKTDLFNACFRIQREASEAAGEHIPLIVENVVAAQKWVGSAKWKFGSFCLWGDIPALMPIRRIMEGRKLPGNNAPRKWSERRVQRLCDATKDVSADYNRPGGKKRKAASAQIAKIPFPLARHIAQVFKPVSREALNA